MCLQALGLRGFMHGFAQVCRHIHMYTFAGKYQGEGSTPGLFLTRVGDVCICPSKILSKFRAKFNLPTDTYYILYYTCLSGQNPQTQLHVSEKPILACTVFGAFFQKFALFSVHRRGGQIWTVFIKGKALQRMAK